MNLEHHVVPKSNARKKKKKLGTCQKDSGVNLKELTIAGIS